MGAITALGILIVIGAAALVLYLRMQPAASDSAATPQPIVEVAPEAPAEPEAATTEPSPDPRIEEAVKIITDPPALSITVDDMPQGMTPTKLKLDPGPHTVVLTSAKAEATFTIEVEDPNDRFCFKAQKKKIALSNCP